MRLTVTLRDQHDVVVETRTGLTAEEAARLAGTFVVLHGADPDGVVPDPAGGTSWAGQPGRIDFAPVGTPALADADLTAPAARFLFPDRARGASTDSSDAAEAGCSPERLLRTIGMEQVLTGLIAAVEGDEPYVQRLRENLTTTLHTYRRRNEDDPGPGGA